MDLKTYLKENGKNYKDLAKGLGKHPVYINTIVSGAMRPGPALAIQISTWTQGAVTLNDLRPDLWRE